MISEKKTSYTLWWFLFLLLNIAIVVWIAFREFHAEHPADAFSLGEAGIWYLLLALLCVGIILATETAKCSLILRFLGEPISLRGAFEVVVLGRYYDALMPTGGGGQPFQIYWLNRKGFSAGACAAMPAAYFITRQAASILLTLLTFLLFRDPGNEAVRIAAYLGLFFCAVPPTAELLFSFQPKVTKTAAAWLIKAGCRLHLIRDYDKAIQKVFRSLSQFHSGISLIAREKKLLSLLLLLSLGCRIALCSLPFCVLRALGSQVPFLSTLAVTIYLYSAVTLIPTPGNSGVSEGAFYMIFTENGISGVFWAMLLWRLFCYYSFLFLGLAVFGRQTLTRSEDFVRNTQGG